MSARTLYPLKTLAAGLFGTLKLMKMYGPQHDTVRGSIEALASQVRNAADGEAEVVLGVRGNRLMVNDHPLRSADVGQLTLRFLSQEFAIREIRFVHLPADATPRELASFIESFLALDASIPDPARRLEHALNLTDAHRIHIEAREEDDDDRGDAPEDPAPAGEDCRKTLRVYVHVLRAFKGVLRSGGVDDPKNVRKARRAVQGLVDNVLEDERALVALSQMRAKDLRLFHHSMNVCVYALLIGHRLGMRRKQLADLGFAALFHDVGKTAAQQPSGDSEDRAAGELRTRKQHPIHGASMLLHAASTQEGMLKAAIAAYEHHAHFDRTGFPEIPHEPHLYSRIVSVADFYEELTSPTEYRERVHSSYEAFSLMREKTGSLFDALLLKIFVNALGIYPVGTLVELNSGEIAMVAEGPREDAEADCPRVRVARKHAGTMPVDTLVDLADVDDEGNRRHTVARALTTSEIFSTLGDFVTAVDAFGRPAGAVL